LKKQAIRHIYVNGLVNVGRIFRVPFCGRGFALSTGQDEPRLRRVNCKYCQDAMAAFALGNAVPARATGNRQLVRFAKYLDKLLAD
jgi:hypothetical protein